MRILIRVLLAAGAITFSLIDGQSYTSYTLPTGDLLSQPSPTFRITQAGAQAPLTPIAYGDQRFTDPRNVTVTNPRVRQFLVEQIAAERPVAVVLNGDVPYSGDNSNDYAVFGTESRLWREAGINTSRSG